MFEKTGCHCVVSQPAFTPIITDIKSQLEHEQFDVQLIDLPGLHDIFPEFSGKQNTTPVEPFPPPRKPHDMDDMVLYIHSSGSTGFPKPIPQRQRTVLQWASSSMLLSTRSVIQLAEMIDPQCL